MLFYGLCELVMTRQEQNSIRHQNLNFRLKNLILPMVKIVNFVNYYAKHYACIADVYRDADNYSLCTLISSTHSSQVINIDRLQNSDTPPLPPLLEPILSRIYTPNNNDTNPVIHTIVETQTYPAELTLLTIL